MCFTPRGEAYVEKMEHIADELTNVSAWGRGLKNLGTKSLKTTMKITKKTVNVATLGTVQFSSKEEEAKKASETKTPPRVFTPLDFYDGTTKLVSANGCVRMR